MDEISLLRSELYSGRRALSALQKELTQAHTERDEALSRLQDLKRSDLAGKVASLQTELASERQARREAEATCASLSHDRQRLQRARDELASNLLESQQRTTDVEDDLAAAEERLAMADAQLQQTRVRTVADASEAQNGSAPGMESTVEGKAEQAAPNQASDSKQQEALFTQVAQLRASRDKLLAELERQFLEVDRLSVENSALSQGMEEAKEAAELWERQAQSSLQQLDRLKDILEESASWSETDAEEQPAREHTSKGERGEEAVEPRRDTENGMAKRYLQECAHVARVESQLQSLCAELRKISAVRSSGKHVTLPALLGVESRLKQLVHGS